MLIYKIVTPHSPKCYVGKTTQTLRKRLWGHCGLFRQWQNMKRKRWCSSFGLLWLGDCTIELLEETDDDQAESCWIQKLDTVNIMTMQWGVGDLRDKTAEARQWRMENKERIYHQRRIYRQVNENHIKAHKSEKIPCEKCGRFISRVHMARHKRTPLCKQLTAAKHSTIP